VVTAARDVIGQPPIPAVEARHQDGIRPVIQEFGGRVHPAAFTGFGLPSPRPPDPLSSPTSSSSFALSIQLHMRRSLTMSTGASPQAPMHSPSFSVKLPSAVVSLKPMPSRDLRCSAAAVAPCSAHGRFVHSTSLKRPTGCRLYIV